ncbi:PAS domain S-box protein [Hymenobacter taeanensis]|uniref:histidine kinase n=1 Tax=Hymenobacter taeanensis TaxID=2735321 RepID=A0A6M6BEG3_9BACT|nr:MULTISPECIES: PAS domain-containing sensor histidine kinase [Hymenobacter]QJX45565.1 PAS domain S-box protein [Hymenobacter taeanensis]UOQ81188.1 PAS domain S-box protein [Hymenobacter sp. 5414T-23]
MRDVLPLRSYRGHQAEEVFFLNPEGEFTFLSETLAELLGHSRQGLHGKPLADWLAPEEHDTPALVLRHARQGEVLTSEVKARCQGGEAQLLLLTTMPVLHHGTLTGIVGIAKPFAEAASHGELTGAQQQLAVIFRTVADVVFVLQAEPEEQYRFTFVNRAFEATTGLPAQQVVGQSVQAIIPEPSLSLVKQHYRQAIETRQRVTWIEVTDYPTGQKVGEVSVTPVYDELTQCWQLVGNVHDLTPQKRVEEELRVSNERFAYALKATTDALYDWNLNTDTVVWGEGFDKLFGYMSAGSPPTFEQWVERLHPEDAALTLEGLRRATSPGDESTWQQEYRFQRANGTWANVFDRGCIIRNEQGQTVRMIGAMQDITTRKEAELRQQQMTQELFLQNTNLQQFTYIVSHNLRAPLANARGFVNLLPRLDKATATYDTALQHLQTSLEQLDAVITDVTTILSIRDKAEVERPKQVPLAAVCQQVLAALNQALQECGGTVELLIADELQVTGHRAYYYSIFFNLLANAIKYRSDKRPLQVTIVATPSEGSGVRVTVTDNGMGFDTEKAGDEVFKLYRRFHSSPMGRGVGLFLVKSQAEAMGGQVTVTSKIEEGTCFTLVLN